jgi:hypothetical protein
MVSSGAINPLFALDQLDDRMQQPVGGRRDTKRFATPHDQPVQMIDLAALAARQILRSRCVLARCRLGNFADGHIDIARDYHAIRFRNGHAFIDEVAHDNGYALTSHEPAIRQLCNRR